MSDRYPVAEAERFLRSFYASPAPEKDSDGLYAIAEQTRKTYLAKLRARDTRVQPFTPLTSDQQRQYLAHHFPEGTPRGIGIQQMEFTSVNGTAQREENRFLGTDYVLDCVALVLVARDAQGRVINTSLAHINAWVDMPKAVRELLGRMPSDSRIDATILGGPDGDNAYMQIDALATVAEDERVRSIRYGFNDASTLAVDTRTGTILTATPTETKETLRSIPEWPINFTFSPKPEYELHAYHLFNRLGQKPVLSLVEIATEGSAAIPPLHAMMTEAIQDRIISEQEVRTIAGVMERYLKKPVTVEIRSGGPDTSEFVFTAMNVELDRIAIDTVTKPDVPKIGTVFAPLNEVASVSR